MADFYCEDFIDGIHWRWKGGPSQDLIRGLTPLCPEDGTHLDISNETPPIANCPKCNMQIELQMELDFLKRRVKIEAERRWKNNSWKKAKQRLSKLNDTLGVR